MKKLVKILVTVLVTLFAGLSSVNAITCEELELTATSKNYFTKTKTNINMVTKERMNLGGLGISRQANFEFYRLKDSKTGTIFASYCRNPGIDSGAYKNLTFVCQKEGMLLDSSDDKKTKIYDAGIIAILKNGYSSVGSAPTIDGNKQYVATTLALRVYESYFTNGSNGDNDTDLNKAHRWYSNVFYRDASDPDVKNLLADLGITFTQFSDTKEVEKWTYSGTSITGDIYNYTRSLLETGLRAALYEKNTGSASLTWNSKPVKTTKTKVEDGVTRYETTLKYTFSAKNFTSTNAYIYIDFKCPECDSKGVSYRVNVNDVLMEVNGAGTPQNLTTLLDDGTGVLKFEIILQPDDTGRFNCLDDLDYEIDLKYKDDTISTEAFSVKSEGCNENPKECQYFYMLYAKDVEREDTIIGTAEICKDCDALEDACSAGDFDACDEYKEECTDCSAYINNAKCTYEDTKIDVEEGYTLDTDECDEDDREEEYNVLSCIIDNQDKAGNSYKATTTGKKGTGDFSDVIDNEYCSVWCKEDYHFTLPGIEEANSGRYFSLKATVKGTKSCYTSKIDKTKFNEDIEEIEKEMIEAYNEYSKYYTFVHPNMKSGLASFRDFRYFINPMTGACSTDGSFYCSQKCINQYYTTYDPNTKQRKQVLLKECYGYGVSATCSPSPSSCVSPDSHYNRELPGYKEELKKWEKKLKTLIQDYKEILNEFNSCAGLETIIYKEGTYNFNEPITTNGWEMNYQYDPTINFWYEEKYMNNVITDELDAVGSVSISEIDQSYCVANTDSAYENCPVGWDDGVDLSNTTKMFVCYQDTSSTNGYQCGFKNLIVSKANYVKQEMTSSASYITPTQFYTIYSTGAIVVSKDGNNISNSSELTNKLPVGLGTRQGVYTYTLQVSDLGEYYNSDELGRIWGDSDSVVAITLDEDSTCQANGALKESATINSKNFKDGVYVCAYQINISKDYCEKLLDKCSAGDTSACETYNEKCSSEPCPGGKCPVECDENGCYIDTCKDNNCPVECADCLYTNNKSNVSYRPITTDDVNPNDRELAENWKWDENVETALELKAYATTKEIEDKGETIYDINYESGATEDFTMKVTMDSKMISKIREYNDRYEDSDGYANNTLKCYDYEGEDGTTYKNVYCYSTFIDELLYDNSTKDKIEITPDASRIIGDDADSTDKKRKAHTQNSGYWTTWSQATNTAWTVTTVHELAYYQKNYGTADVNIGPSWK